MEVSEVPARQSHREILLALKEELRQVVVDLDLPQGERPSLLETQDRARGLILALGVLADQLRDDEGLRPHAEAALDHLMGAGNMGERLSAASVVLMKALGKPHA